MMLVLVRTCHIANDDPKCNFIHMIRMRISFFLANVAVISSGVSGHTPIIPPDPIRLAAAKDLILVLPIESAVSDLGSGYDIREGVTKDALEWLQMQPNLNRDGIMEQLFADKVGYEVDSQISKVVQDIRSELAEDYAHRLSEHDISAVKAFVQTSHGKSFLRMQMEKDGRITRRVRQALYLKILPKFPQLLDSALESRAILKSVNQGR